MELSKPIGILGGTFDPIHFGHLRMALELQSAFDLAKVYFAPCHDPVHREKPLASAENRFAMVEAALNDTALFIADKREIKRGGPSYTVDSLKELKQEFPTTPLCLLVGIDAFIAFKTWHRYDEILSLCHIIVAHRPHYELPKSGEIADLINKLEQKNPDYIHKNPAGGVFIQPITALEISASAIRDQIKNNKNPRYLLPDAVYNYIMQHRIYFK